MLSTLASTALGLYILMYAVPLLPPLMEKLMVRPNRPDGYWMPRFGFFTDLQPGRVKVKVTWFGTFVTCLMNWQGKRFVGEDPDNHFTHSHQGYWEVVDSGDLPDSHPLPFPMPRGGREWWIWLLYSPFSVAFWA